MGSKSIGEGGGSWKDTLRNIPEDNDLCSDHHENLQSPYNNKIAYITLADTFRGIFNGHYTCKIIIIVTEVMRRFRNVAEGPCHLFLSTSFGYYVMTLPRDHLRYLSTFESSVWWLFCAECLSGLCEPSLDLMINSLCVSCLQAHCWTVLHPMCHLETPRWIDLTVAWPRGSWVTPPTGMAILSPLTSWGHRQAMSTFPQVSWQPENKVWLPSASQIEY